MHKELQIKAQKKYGCHNKWAKNMNKTIYERNRNDQESQKIFNPISGLKKLIKIIYVFFSIKLEKIKKENSQPGNIHMINDTHTDADSSINQNFPRKYF